MRKPTILSAVAAAVLSLASMSVGSASAEVDSPDPNEGVTTIGDQPEAFRSESVFAAAAPDEADDDGDDEDDGDDDDGGTSATVPSANTGNGGQGSGSGSGSSSLPATGTDATALATVGALTLAAGGLMHQFGKRRARKVGGAGAT